MNGPATITRDRLRTEWGRLTAIPATPERSAWGRARRARHPRFFAAVRADALEATKRRGETWEYDGRLYLVSQVIRLCVVTDSFFAQVCYRGKAALQRRRVPIVPRLLHRLAITHGQICIGDPVVVEAGVYFPHGQVVLDGIAEVGAHTAIAPFSTVGLTAGDFTGPVIGRGCRIGTGVRILGDITLGANCVVGANAVVVHDVEPGQVVVGVPARPLPPKD